MIEMDIQVRNEVPGRGRILYSQCLNTDPRQLIRNIEVSLHFLSVLLISKSSKPNTVGSLVGATHKTCGEPGRLEDRMTA